MSGTWSEQIEQRYCLQLPDDVRAYLDEEIWKQEGGAEFCRARSPEQLLDPEPGTIWAGFMLPDTLPLIGNDYGDWLCVRIAANGAVSELVHWSHCGGDWLPCGRSLAEGLLYDAAVRVLHPSPPHLAESNLSDEQVFRPAQWARRWITPPRGISPPGATGGIPADRTWPGSASMPPFWQTESGRRVSGARAAVLECLSNWQVAEFAVQRDRILHHLESPLKAMSDQSLSQEMGVAWEPDFVRWLFDAELVPESARRELMVRTNAGGVDLFRQDWDAAEQEAQSVIRRRQDLGWAFDIAGWAAQRRGDWAIAIEHYLAGLRTSWFSDDTVRFRTHWFDEGYGKFAASRLATLTRRLSARQRRDPYLNIFLDNDSRSLRRRVCDYWLQLAHESDRQRDHLQAYQHYYRAGWDLGLEPLNGYGAVFEGLCRSAAAAGSPALASIAAMHQSFLVEA